MESMIERFKTEFHQIAKPSLFEVTLVFPSGNEVAAQFLCKGASVPTRTIGKIDLSYMGRKVVVPGDTSFSDWSVTVYNDRNFTIRRRLEEWAELINGAFTNLADTVEAHGLKRTMTVKHLDGKGFPIKTYYMIGCMPTSVGSAIDLSWERTDTAEEYSVDFAYDYWESDTTKGTNAGGGFNVG